MTKNSRGFVSIGIIIAIVVGTLVTAGVGYGAFKYKKVLDENERLSEQVSDESLLDGTGDISSTTAPDIGTIDILDIGQNTPPSDSSAEENFNIVVIEAINNWLELDELLIDYADDVLAYVQNDLDRMTRTRNQTQATSGGSELGELFINAYNADINQINTYKNYFSDWRDILEENIANFEGSRARAYSTFVTREESISSLKTLSNSSYHTNARNQISEELERFFTER